MKEMKKVRLNLGSGDKPLDDYVNLDRKNNQEVYPLTDWADNSVDEIRASHILEHFGRREVFGVLQNWVSKLKIGGVLKIAVPDFGRLAALYTRGEELDFAGYICGGQTDANDFHKTIFDEKKLRKLCGLLGLKDIKRWQSAASDCASYPISLNLQGTKTVEDLLFGEVVFADPAYRPLLEDLSRKRRNVYSQTGEDGIIEAVFATIGAENKWCLEVGAADGIMFSNTRRLVEQGWNAILIEKDPEQYAQLVENCKQYPAVNVFNIEIGGENSIDSILKKCAAPKDIDLVCIDVDGQDWHLWNQMIEYHPRVIIIEYNQDDEQIDFIPSVGGDGQAGKGAIQKLAIAKLYHNSIVTKYNIISLANDIKVVDMRTIEAPPVPQEQVKDIKIIDNHTISAPPTPQEQVKDIKIYAVMSMARLAFTDNMFSAIRSLIPLGINLEKGCGIFWGQVLTRLIEMHLDDGTEYILTVDYDTWFTKNQVIRLLQLMQENPEADAIIPLQIKRECDFPLIGRINEGKKAYTQIAASEFEKDLMPITTGHFGLTAFRVESLKKLKKPWFLPRPDPEGSWNDGRQDEDIYFWHNFADSGLQAFLAPRIGLPHLELMATLPGRLEDGFKPIYYHITDLDKNGLPEWCEPQVTFLK